MNTTMAIILVGCLGGILPELLRIIKNKDHLSETLKNVRGYLIGLIAQIIVGGAVAYLAFSANMLPGNGAIVSGTLLAAAAYGFSAPEILTRLMAIPNFNGQVLATDNQGYTLRQWWAL